MKTKLLLLIVLFNSYMTAIAQVAPAAQSIKGKVISGYQGWFNAYGDGSPVARWRHWSAGQYNTNNGLPAPGYLSFEAYPDVSEYPASVMFQTGLGNLNDGSSAKLFTSYPYETIDLHFKWMQDNELDGVALQRFLGETRDGVFKRNRDSITVRMRRAAEKYQRIFYIMYDMSADDTTYFKNDWLHVENDLNVLSSPYYAHQDGKPVICLWGFGFTGRANVPVHSLAIINWLKAKGYYVVGGVPTNWRNSNNDSHPGYLGVYSAFDMISPWSVGRFSNTTGADNFKTNYLIPDLAYCNTNGIDYQPVLFSGFAWSNWNGGAVNQIPRAKGEFFWRQLKNVKDLGMNTAYIAMFDEYDEATNIMKMADSYFAVPDNQYFLTTSADGSYISSDFYLRLTNQATKVLKGTAALTTNVSIPFSVAPLWFRTSVEVGYDATLTWVDSPDPSSIPINVTSPQCGIVQNETRRTGTYSIRVAGTDNASSGGSYYYFRTIDVNIPINANTRLSFWSYPTNNISRYVSVDLIMTDGTTLRGSGAVDQNGISMHPGAGRGTVNTWNQTQCHLGNWLNGKTIDRIIIAYDHGADTGNFRTFFDDIVIRDSATPLGVLTTNTPPVIVLKDDKAELEKQVDVYPQPAYSTANVRFSEKWQGHGNITILNSTGERIGYQVINSNPVSLPVSQLPSGLYLLRIEKGGQVIVKKLLVAH